MRANFSEVFEDVTKLGCKIPKEHYLDKGDYPIIDQGQKYIAGYSNNSEGLYSDVPAIIFGDHTRIIKYVDMPCFLGADGVKLLHVKDKDNDVKYLYYALCNARIPDTGYNRHFKWLKELEIPLPPLPEQRHIAAVLDKVSELIALRKRQLDLLDEMVKARFVEMFGTINENPKHYPMAMLKDICHKITDGKHGGCEQESNSGYFYVGAREIFDNSIHYETAPQITYTDFAKDYKRCNIEVGDFVIVNTGATIGKSAIATSPLTERTLLQKSVALLKVNTEHILSEFLRYCYIVNPSMYMVESASAQPNLLLSKIKTTVVYTPPIKLQNQFADFVQQVDKSKAAVQQGLDRLILLKSALMQEYFG